MIKSQLGIILFLIKIIGVYSVYEVISSSFQGNSFTDFDNWQVTGAYPKVTDCKGIRLFGGYPVFAKGVSASKIFLLPPHYSINLQLQFWKIDSWDNEYAFINVDYDNVWTKMFSGYMGKQICGRPGEVWTEYSMNLNLNIKHSGATAVVVITTDLDQSVANESWGFKEFILSVQRCPEGCLLCQETDTILDCYLWKLIQTSWNSLDVSGIGLDGWNVASGIPQATKCGSVALFGGYRMTGVGTVITQSFFNIPPHFQLKIQILWAKIDSWDIEAAQIRVDGALRWERTFSSNEGYYWKICGNSYPTQRAVFYRVELDVEHTNSQVEISFSTTLNQSTDTESFGLRDFGIFYGSCPDNCVQCTGPTGDKCLMCNQGFYNTGVIDKICEKCYPSCYECEGPNIDNCTDCGDPNIYHKQFVNGKCICSKKAIEQVQNDGTTLCLPCHQRCEKCYLPEDNTVNEYCTMCIAGQNRVVSDQLYCICKEGYGEDGISDICFECHYTCENCNGQLANNCTTCSSQSNRHLTSDNQCLCNKAYIDTGIDDIICLYICHPSCSDCDIPGEDKCTSCPTTREPDGIGITFKCQCKDSHYFSDGTQLECLECHLTCKTCNGIQDNNCLTCDLSYRQLVMNKCICLYGYYDIGLLECSPCYYTCMTCFGPEEDNCLTCDVNTNREFKANKCSCLDTYIEKLIGDPICYKCSYRCANCTGTIENCTSCPLFSFRDLGTNNSCTCPDKSYDEPENPICIICNNNCQTCNGSQSNQCTSCNAQMLRQLDPSGSCLCMIKYFDVGMPECQACSSYCLNCQNSAENCISCKSDRYLEGNVCKCLTKLNGATISSYQISGKVQCQSCHYSCSICNGSTSTKCISCLDSEMRILQNSSCVCISHYFDNGKPKCQQCKYSCETCEGLDTTCLSCYPNTFRTLINQQCKCQNGYFDDGSNPLCQKCHYSCSECRSISTKCDACLSTTKRLYNSLLFTCNCLDSYYDSGVAICSKCHYSCFKCDAFGFQSCQSCIDKQTSFRILNSGVCQCLPGYFDDGISPDCKICSIQCLTCLNTAFYCTTCITTRHLQGNTCQCDLGYFDIKLDICSKCDQNCYACTINSKNCTDCDQSLMKILDNATKTCICKAGTTEINGQCQICDITCQTCSNSITNCTSCQTLRLLINNECICIDGTYEIGNDKKCLFCNKTCYTCINSENYCTSCSADNNRIISTGNICICQDGYFEDSITLSCKPCDQSCLTCKVSPTYCLTCNAQYNLSLNNQNRCICSPGFYFDISILKCEACNIQCKECQTLTKCIECENITRYFDPDELKCPCKDGYYENNLKICAQCDISCKTCINQSTNCLSCESTYFKILNNSNQCICLDGYYDLGIEMCQPCNQYCKTCMVTSTKCTSCNQALHFRLLNLNQCICQNGYYDNNKLICEKCSNQCQTCKGKRDYCISCDTNQNRIDQSIIHKCPCVSGFYSDQNENCSKCHIRCQTCNQSKDNCISCAGSNTSNRFSISKNCICKDGYFDDGIEVECKKCSPRCKLCQDSSTNCLTCFSNLRETPPICDCKVGFFENSSQNCEQCENQCLTCEMNANNCLTCKEGRFTQLCLCQDGYYEAGEPLCVQCDFKCKTCKDSQIDCLSCKGDRINIPRCECPEGFYDDLINEACQFCDELCKICSVDGCLVCNANRILSPEMSCIPPPNSVSHSDTPWCSTCEVAVLDVRLSDDLLSIQVKFDFPLNPSFFITKFQDNICFKILLLQTYQLLGKNPNCYLDPDDDTKLILKVGQNVKIVVGDKILFQENYFGHQDCDKKLHIFIFDQIQNPINPVSPKLLYDIPTYLINPCDDNIIPLKQKINDGLRNFIGVKWTYHVEGSNGNGDLDNFVDQLTNLQMLELVIPLQTLPKQSNITLNIEFQNFVGQKNIQIIKLSTHSGQFPTILWISKPYYYTFEAIILEFQIKKKDCSESTITQIDNSEYSLSLVEIYRNDSNSRPSRVNYQEKTKSNSFNVIIQNYTLTSRIAYTFSQTTLDPLLNFSIIRNVTLEISSGGIVCQFNGTKKIHNYRKDTQIQIYCKDLDSQYDWNEDTGIRINVECADLALNLPCMDFNKKIIKVNKTDYIQIIPKYTIQPYSIQSWTVVASKNQYSYTFKQYIVFIDNDFKLLNVTYSQGYIMRSVNNYENLEFTINLPFEDRQYLLEFQLAMIYNFELIKILHSEYFQFQLRIFDYFQEFTKGNQINLKFLAQFTNEIIPSQADVQVMVNQPPTCQVSFREQTIQALKPLKIITICDFSNTYPFQYQLRYFLQNQDLIDFLNRKSDYSLILNSYQSSNIMEGYFPLSDGVLVIQAIDSMGSYLNIEKQLNVTKTLLNCSEININKYILKQKISLLLEILLNHQNSSYCINLSKQLYMNIQTYLEAEDTNDQILVYQTTKLYKRLIQDFHFTESPNRLLNDNSDFCFDNSTATFYGQIAQMDKVSTVTPTSLQEESKKLTANFQKIIKQLSNYDDKIHQNVVFLDEKYYQKKESLLDSLVVMLFLIDDLFIKIPTAIINTSQDKEQIINVAEELLSLIQKIVINVNSKAKVNGPGLTVKGQMLNWQLSKITKDMLNKQFNIDRDMLDGLIDFVQKEQIELNYNYFNLSQELQTQLQALLNLNSLEINEKYYKKTKLQNHLYNNQFRDYQGTIREYIIDMFKAPYCLDQIPQEKLYSYNCVNINQNWQFYKCNFLTEELDNQTVQVSCQCQSFGSIFLIKYLNNSNKSQNIIENLYNKNGEDNLILKLIEQPILLFHGIFIAFSFFFYCQLVSMEIKEKQQTIYNQADSDLSQDEIKQKSKKIRFYPGNFTIFKISFKFIHEVLSLFYIKSTILKTSYRFLQLSIKISILIPLSFFLLSFIDQITIFSILFVNCVVFLIIRMILKIFQSIYRFGGRWSMLIVSIYLLLHLLCYIQFILQLKQCQKEYNIINIEIFQLLISSLFLFYVILDPIMIILRIITYKFIIRQIREEPINPQNQLIYFFVQHQKLGKLFDKYAIL